MSASTVFSEAESEPPVSKRGPVCQRCGNSLAHAPNVTGEMLESFCETDACTMKALVVKRTPLQPEHVERFGRTPTNAIVFGKGIGGVVPERIQHQIMQQNRNVVKIENGRIIERGDAFTMATSEGRLRLKAERCQLKTRNSSTEEDKDVKKALELLSNHNMSLPSCVSLSVEQIDRVASFVRAGIRKAKTTRPSLTKKNLVVIINAVLAVNGSPMIRQREGGRIVVRA